MEGGYRIRNLKFGHPNVVAYETVQKFSCDFFSFLRTGMQ
jgi:hypothetical protein